MKANEARELAIINGASVDALFIGECLMVLNRIKDKCLAGELTLLYNPKTLNEKRLNKILIMLQEKGYVIKYTDFGYLINWG